MKTITHLLLALIGLAFTPQQSVKTFEWSDQDPEIGAVRTEYGCWIKFEESIKVNDPSCLDKMIRFLEDHPNIVIEIGVHSDEMKSIDTKEYGRITDEAEIAQTLWRAAMLKELVLKKVKSQVRGEESRKFYKRIQGQMVPKGYGRDYPLIPLKELRKLPTQEEKLAAHAKNRRVVFKILNKNYL